MGYYDAIPARLIEALERYEQDGILPGHFLQAVLRNDLIGAVCRADDNSYAALKQIVHYVHNEMPSKCWGNAARVNIWVLGKTSRTRGGLTN